MRVAEIKFTAWEKSQYYHPGDLSLFPGDRVVAEFNGAEELGQFIQYKEIGSKSEGDNDAEGKTELKSLIRKAGKEDLEKNPSKKEKEKVMEDCRALINKHGLDMKLVDVHFSFDRTKITFAFAADGRVDFRILVRELTSHFNCIIRLHQIGKRDEAKIIGDCGPCGKPLCCRQFIKDFTSITSKMAETQQVVHRGSERISGMCARLKCCLEYEQEGYKELAANLPSVGDKIKVEDKEGMVVNCNVLKQTVDVKINGNGGEGGSNIVEVDISTGEAKQRSKQ